MKMMEITREVARVTPNAVIGRNLIIDDAGQWTIGFADFHTAVRRRIRH
jgi:hypothetical protein